jgi:hypothetical protein
MGISRLADRNRAPFDELFGRSNRHHPNALVDSLKFLGYKLAIVPEDFQIGE